MTRTSPRTTARTTTSPLSAPGPTVPAGPQPRLPAWGRVLLVVLAFVASASAVGLALLVPGLREAIASSDPVTHAVAVLTAWPLTAAAFALSSLLLVTRVDRRPASALGWRLDGSALVGLAAGTALSALGVLGATGVIVAVGAVSVGPPTGGAVVGLPAWLAVLYVVGRALVLQGFGEELLMRGYLLQTLRSRPRRAVAVSVLVFALLHLLSSGGQVGAAGRVAYLAVPLGLALCAAGMAVRTRRVWSAVGVHVGAHVVDALLPWELTGVGAGTWLVTGAVLCVLGLLILRGVSPSRWEEMSRLGPYGS